MDDSASSWTLYKLVGFNMYIDGQTGKGWPYPVYVQTSVLGEKYYRNNIFEFGETLEPNENLDTYDIIKEFLSKLGHRTQKDTDVTDTLQNILTLLNAVNIGVDLALTGQEMEAAEQTVDILIDRKTLQTTFKPINTENEFSEQKKKAIEK